MSKVLEAFLKIRTHLGENLNIWNCEEYAILVQALTPPTADEVCEALSEEFGHTYYYDEELRDFWCEEFGSDDHMITWYLSNEPLNELVDYPHLMTLIGRFYEGLEEEMK